MRTLGQQLNSLQWICIFVQCCAIAITQYDNCTSKAFLSLKAYLLMVASAFLTASVTLCRTCVRAAITDGSTSMATLLATI